MIGDRTVFKSPSVEALLHFKWRALGSVLWRLHACGTRPRQVHDTSTRRAFGSVIWWLHTALWLSYTLATAVFAYAATYYFTDSQSAWKETHVSPPPAPRSAKGAVRLNPSLPGGQSMPFSFRAPYDYFMDVDAPLMDELRDCAKKFGFPLLPKPPGGQRTERAPRHFLDTS